MTTTTGRQLWGWHRVQRQQLRRSEEVGKEGGVSEGETGWGEEGERSGGEGLLTGRRVLMETGVTWSLGRSVGITLGGANPLNERGSEGRR